jgi:Zn-dependent peptidase ImmA (M78 family)
MPLAATVGQIRKTAREDAARVLSVYWTARLLPVDPIEIATRMGVSVYTARLSGDTMGMIVGSDDSSADIYLAESQPPKRLRFTCAHELGHYVDNTSTLKPNMAYVDRRSDQDRGQSNEVYANEFAGSLLMPEEQLRELVAQGLDDFGIAAHLDVSLDALRYRRRLLGI